MDHSSKESTLSKYREDESDYSNDFDDLHLSYSKFSHVSGISFSKNRESPFVQKIKHNLLVANKENFSSSPSPFVDSTNKLNHRKLRIEPPVKFDLPNPPFAESRTPDRKRNPSVKVSLTPAQRVEKRPGTRLNNALENFQFSNLVGKGAFANVYKGINLKTKQVVAIKQITLEPNQDVADLMGEIDLLKILKHPNIVKYHGFVKTSSSLNVFLEFCAGGSLRQLYKRLNHGVPEQDIIKYVKLILHGLNYLHEQGVVHRDVKAANVLITEKGIIKLADFGVATKVSSQHYSVVGTPNWMAPETVLGGEGLCTASDIWSLGATIIELFTMNPPYHELNPMATLHAIGTDEHPPLPKNISSLAKDFLLECFQKQPNLRINAKLLLKHKWITKEPVSKVHSPNPTIHVQKPIQTYSEQIDENWDGDFEINSNQLKQPVVISPETIPSEKYSKTELLDKFSEKNDNFDFDDQSKLYFKSVEESPDNDNSDPFLALDIENFDTNELEIQSKMEFLIGKFSTKLDSCHAGDDDVVTALVKITGRMLHLVKKYPILHDILIRDHGILSLLELLESVSEIPRQNKLWYHTLTILNTIFDRNVSQFENFCLLGGIPVVNQFRSPSYDIHVRLQTVRFIKFFKKSEKALLMFVSSGGLRVLSKFSEEDFDYHPEFPLAAIDGIHDILSKNLTRYKSDVCRILSKYGVVFWFVVLLNRLTKFKPDENSKVTMEQAHESIDQIFDILKSFSNSEVRVRINISSVDLFKLLIKVFPKLEFGHQLTTMKFLRSMSCVPSLLKSLHAADILEFLVKLLQDYTPSSEHYKEVVNTICPTLFNCCYLNHAREIELVKLGTVPVLKQLSKVNLEFRQFVLPILCELVYCDHYVRQVLVKHNILSVYFNLLLDPYWQANALDSIIHWTQQEPKSGILASAKAVDCIISGFLIPKASNLESALDNYLKLVTANRAICDAMAKDVIVHNILKKLSSHNRNPVVQLSLLRTLNTMMARQAPIFQNEDIGNKIIHDLNNLKSKESSVLVGELVHEITLILTL